MCGDTIQGTVCVASTTCKLNYGCLEKKNQKIKIKKTENKQSLRANKASFFSVDTAQKQFWFAQEYQANMNSISKRLILKDVERYQVFKKSKHKRTKL